MMERSVLDWLDGAAERFPERRAYADGARELTFAQVQRIAQLVGTAVARRTAGGRSVAVLLGRSALTPACFLGIAAAGCFYAPMDAALPPSRLRQMAEVVKADHLVTDREHEALARELGFSDSVLLVEDVLSGEPDAALLAERRRELTLTSPLYLIFTSGSGGVPKGVLTSHLSLLCYIEAVGGVLGITEEDVLGGQSPLDYIAAIREIYLPLRYGASAFFLPKSLFAMPAGLFEALDRERVTTLCWSVSALAIPVTLGAFGCRTPGTVHKICFTGSVMPARILKIWREHLPEALFVNQYGPTEATASCTYYIVGDNAGEDERLPIGKPYPNYRVLLLDGEGCLTRPGEIGEICVGGPGVTLGYYGDLERTTAAFVQNPLCPEYRDVLYRTGDLGRQRPDGLLEFHGRQDRQIKHLGHRVELDEVEKAAEGLYSVGQACAMYDGDRELLWLFYTGDAETGEVTAELRKVLPPYMVPRRLLRMPGLPALPGGKTDLQALKAYMH